MAIIDFMSAEELYRHAKTHGKIVFSKKNAAFTLFIYKMNTEFTEIITDAKNSALMSAVVHDHSFMLQNYGRLF